MSLAKFTRSIEVYKYKHDIEENLGEAKNKEVQQTGRINNLLSATVVVSGFGDPVPTIVCDMNENNMQLIQIGHLVKMKVNEYALLQPFFTIVKINYNTDNKTITFIGDIQFNEIRNGINARSLKWYTSASGGQLEMFHIIQDYFTVSPIKNYPHYYVDSNLIKTNYEANGGFKYFTIDPQNKTMLEVIGGTKGSIQDMFGGEFDKTQALDGHVITHRKQLGRPNLNMVLSTSVNVTGIDYTVDATNILNGVVHLYSYQSEKGSLTLGNDIIWTKSTDTTAVDYFGKFEQLTSKLADKEARWGSVIIKDWADGGNNALGDPNKDGLKFVQANMVKRAAEWDKANKHRSLPVETIKFDFNSIRKSQQLDHLADIMKLGLGDSIKVHVKELNRTIQGRVSGYTYNVISDTYDNLTIGSALKTIVDKID